MGLGISRGKLDEPSKRVIRRLRGASQIQIHVTLSSFQTWVSSQTQNAGGIGSLWEGILQLHDNNIQLKFLQSFSQGTTFIYSGDSVFEKREYSNSSMIIRHRVRIYTWYPIWDSICHTSSPVRAEYGDQFRGSIAIQWGCLGPGNKWNLGVLGLADSGSIGFMDPLDSHLLV